MKVRKYLVCFGALIVLCIVCKFLFEIKLGPGYEIKTENIQNQIKTGDFFSNLQNISGRVYRGPGKILYTEYDKFLDNTTQYIKMQTYEFTNQFFKTNFQKLSKKGVDISVIVEDNKYQQYENTLKNLKTYFSGDENIQIKNDNQMGTTYVHSKIMLNENSFWIQTANLTKSSFESNREHFFYSEDKKVHDSLNQLFEYDWNGKDLHNLDIHPNLVVCPINCRDVIKTLLESAEKSIVIQTQYIVDDEILDILYQKSEEIDMAIIVADTNDNQGLISYFGPGIARMLSTNYNHTKMILVDEKYLLLGSMNLSENSLDNNREIGIVLIDPEQIKVFVDGFKKDWERSL